MKTLSTYVISFITGVMMGCMAAVLAVEYPLSPLVTIPCAIFINYWFTLKVLKS